MGLSYYRQYPALTIGFYPPGLHVVLAVAFLLFGTSHAAALAVIGFFLFALAAALYLLLRRVVAPAAASTAILLLLAGPEMVVWSQQVMLEVPMMALAAWSTWFLLRHGETGRPTDLWLAAALLVAALYTKQTALLPLAGAALGLVAWRGPGLLTRRHSWMVVAVTAVALLPLAIVQLKLGAFNVTSVMHREDVPVPQGFNLAALAWYGARLPEMFGPVLVALAAAAPVLLALRRGGGLPTGLLLIQGGWLVAAYLGLSVIALKETRHGLLLGVPLAILAALAIDRALSRGLARWLAVPVAAALLGWALHARPTPIITGYRAVADEVVRRDSDGGKVMVLSSRDGSFIVNLRLADPGRRFSVVRADKVFLDIAIMPELGLNPRDMSEDEVREAVARMGVEWVVAVPGLWQEAPVIASLHRLLGSDAFEAVGRFPVEGRAAEKEVILYRNRAAPPREAEDPEIILRGVGLKL